MVSKYANQVSDGMDVVDTNEEKIGTVQDVYDTSGEGSSSGGGYLQIPTGFLGLGKEHHIPFSAITNVRDNQIYLNVAKDRLNELGYDAAPIEKEDTFDGDMVDRTTTVATDTTLPARDVARRDLTTDGARKLQLREEELVARTRSVKTGEVGLHTQVVSEQRTLEVPVTHEEVTIERHAVDRRPSERPIGESETISVPVSAEQVTLDKKAVVYEEVNVGTRKVQETEHVSDTVRREEAVIKQDGDVTIEGDTRTPSRP